MRGGAGALVRVCDLCIYFGVDSFFQFFGWRLVLEWSSVFLFVS